MSKPFSNAARYVSGAIAISVFASLALQVNINLEPGQSLIESFGQTMRFFTIWTNLAGGIVMGWTAWKGKADPRILFALTTAMVIVAVVYHMLLAGEHHPVGLDWWTNLMFHTIIPAAIIIWWLAYSRVSNFHWKSLPVVMIFPLLYAGFALIHGALTGFYAYFFLDLPALGWPQLLVNMIGLSAFFMIVGAALMAFRTVMARFLVS